MGATSKGRERTPFTSVRRLDDWSSNSGHEPTRIVDSPLQMGYFFGLELGDLRNRGPSHSQSNI